VAGLFYWGKDGEMRLSIKTFYISMAIFMIIFIIGDSETHADAWKVKDWGACIIEMGKMTNVNGTLFFTVDDCVHGRELWKSDGTEAGTVMVKDIEEGVESSDPDYLTNVNGTLFFGAIDNAALNYTLWKSDGTEAGTVKIAGAPYPPFDVRYLTNVNGTLFFQGKDNHGIELWKSDGTEAGTVEVADIWPETTGSNPGWLTPAGSVIFFNANDGTTGQELWKSDGTEAGTVRVADIWQFELSSNPMHLTHFQIIVAFSANDGIYGRELWASPLGFGAYLIKDIATATGNPLLSSNPESLTVIGGTLFFVATAYDGTGRELWKSDGTEAGTVMVKDIIPPGDGGPEILTNVNGTLYFRADDGVHGIELWKSDGTEAGTVMVKDIHPTGNGSPMLLTDVDGTLFFTGYSMDSGVWRKLWKSDGTSAGTVVVPLPDDREPKNLFNLNGTLYFTQGSELWMYKEEDFPWELFIPAFIDKHRP
jgi:ELWxxDGT repeat protein